MRIVCSSRDDGVGLESVEDVVAAGRTDQVKKLMRTSRIPGDTEGVFLPWRR